MIKKLLGNKKHQSEIIITENKRVPFWDFYFYLFLFGGGGDLVNKL